MRERAPSVKLDQVSKSRAQVDGTPRNAGPETIGVKIMQFHIVEHKFTPTAVGMLIPYY